MGYGPVLVLGGLLINRLLIFFCFNFLLLNHLDAVQDEMDMSPVEIDALMIEEDVSDDEDDDHEEVVCQTIYFPLFTVLHFSLLVLCFISTDLFNIVIICLYEFG